MVTLNRWIHSDKKLASRAKKGRIVVSNYGPGTWTPWRERESVSLRFPTTRDSCLLTSPPPGGRRNTAEPRETHEAWLLLYKHVFYSLNVCMHVCVFLCMYTFIQSRDTLITKMCVFVFAYVRMYLCRVFWKQSFGIYKYTYICVYTYTSIYIIYIINIYEQWLMICPRNNSSIFSYVSLCLLLKPTYCCF